MFSSTERISFSLPKDDAFEAWRLFHEQAGLPMHGCLANPYQPYTGPEGGDVWLEAGIQSLVPEAAFDSLIGQHCDLPKPIGLWDKPA